MRFQGLNMPISWPKRSQSLPRDKRPSADGLRPLRHLCPPLSCPVPHPLLSATFHDSQQQIHREAAPPAHSLLCHLCFADFMENRYSVSTRVIHTMLKCSVELGCSAFVNHHTEDWCESLRPSSATGLCFRTAVCD